jgi:hypothetical protein
MNKLYYKTHKVPGWVVLGKMSKKNRNSLIKFVTSELGGYHFDSYPNAQTALQIVMNIRKNLGQTQISATGVGYKLYPTLCQLIIKEMVYSIHPHAALSSAIRYPPGKSWLIEKPEDYLGCLEEYYMAVDPIFLSQNFKVLEITEKGFGGWISYQQPRKEVLTKIANRVTVVADDDSGDVKISNDNLIPSFIDALSANGTIKANNIKE